MTELIRDTVLGHLLRFVSGKRLLKYQEEADPSLWKRYVDAGKSGNMATYGQTMPPESEETEKEEVKPEDGERPQLRTNRTGSSTSTQVMDEVDINAPSGKKVDPEKGKDIHVVDWWGPNDPEVSTSQIFCPVWQF